MEHGFGRDGNHSALLKDGVVLWMHAWLDGDFDVNKTYANKFSDVHDGTWYQNYINFAVEKNYISGDENGLCRPEDMISRAEFASIIARYINIDPLDGEDKFTDIARFDWCN